ncbi:MAG: serine hydrolase [Woeseiaceae bacterium]
MVGAEILIIQHGRTLLHEAYGWSDRDEKRPLERNSIYRIRSMTKPVTGTAVLMLVEDGKIALDDPVGRFLPSFDNKRSQSVTVRQLLTHTSGLGNHGREDIGLKQDDHDYASLRQLVDEIGGIGPRHSPGSFHYSDSGSATLGAIVEQVSGMPVEHFIEERILSPLGMDDTYTAYVPGADWSGRVNSTYVLRQGSCEFDRYWDPSMEQDENYFQASGGLYSTVSDYAKFLAAWMKPGESGILSLSPGLARQAVTPENVRGDGRGYGMHWDIYAVGDQDGLPAAFGHGGSDGTIALAIPGMDAMVLFFTQSRGSEPRLRLFAEFARLELFGNVFPRNPMADEMDSQWESIRADNGGASESGAGGLQPDEENQSRYVGTYAHPRFEHKIVYERSGLAYSFGDPPGLAPMFPLSEGIFIGEHPCAGFKFRVTFDTNDTGAVAGYSLEVSLGWQGEFERRKAGYPVRR